MRKVSSEWVTSMRHVAGGTARPARGATTEAGGRGVGAGTAASTAASSIWNINASNLIDPLAGPKRRSAPAAERAGAGPRYCPARLRSLV